MASLQSILTQSWHRDIAQVAWMCPGLNSKVLKIRLTSGDIFVAKFYHVYDGDSRDRLTTETRALQFLWDQGFRCVAPAVFIDPEQRCAIYPFIPGRHLRTQDIRRAHITHVLQFIRDLQTTRDAAAAYGLSNASEAFFALQGHYDCVQTRYARLQSIKGDEVWNHFVQKYLSASWSRVQRSVTALAQELNVRWDDVLAQDQRILSPSDLGFHNILVHCQPSFWINSHSQLADLCVALSQRIASNTQSSSRPDLGHFGTTLYSRNLVNSTLVASDSERCHFLDFEYFGWDDPAKMLCDFSLHPGVPVPPALSAHMTRMFIQSYPATEARAVMHRMRILYPLLKFKFSLIMLNAYLPERAHLFDNLERVRQEQLRKAIHNLRSLHEDLACRPCQP